MSSVTPVGITASGTLAQDSTSLRISPTCLTYGAVVLTALVTVREGSNPEATFVASFVKNCFPSNCTGLCNNGQCKDGRCVCTHPGDQSSVDPFCSYGLWTSEVGKPDVPVTDVCPGKQGLARVVC